MKKLTTAALICCLFIVCLNVYGDVKLPRLISDGMVLQRGRGTKIWGWADVNEQIAEAEPSLKEKIIKVMEGHSDRHIEDIIEPIGYLLVPIFFVVTGMTVKLETMFAQHLLF